MHRLSTAERYLMDWPNGLTIQIALCKEHSTDSESELTDSVLAVVINVGFGPNSVLCSVFYSHPYVYDPPLLSCPTLAYTSCVLWVLCCALLCRAFTPRDSNVPLLVSPHSHRPSRPTILSALLLWDSFAEFLRISITAIKVLHNTCTDCPSDIEFEFSQNYSELWAQNRWEL